MEIVRPCILVKSRAKILYTVFTEYTLYYIYKGKVVEQELENDEARELLREYKLPEIYRLDHNNIIYGDEEFKDKCPKSFIKKIDNQLKEGL